MSGTDRKPFLLAHFKRINVQLSLESLELINTLCNLYLLSKPDTNPSSMSIVLSHGKKCQNYFCVTSYLALRRNVARWDIVEERNEEKDDRFWLLSGIFRDYIKQSIIMAVLRK